MTDLADILRDLRSYDEEPFDWRELLRGRALDSEFTGDCRLVAPKGGLPEDAAKLRLVRLVEVEL